MKLDEAARAYLGTPWLHQGRSRQGIDCVGLLVLSVQDCGYEIQDYTAYIFPPNGRDIGTHLLPQFERGSVHEIWPGEVALFGRPDLTHIGIVSDRGHQSGLSLIHVPYRGLCCEVGLFNQKIRGVYRWPK